MLEFMIREMPKAIFINLLFICLFINLLPYRSYLNILFPAGRTNFNMLEAKLFHSNTA